jgi:thioredoxin 1
MNNIIEVNEQNFEQEVVKAGGPVLVDFYATWCGPCKMLAPMLDSLAGEFAGRVKFAKLDVDAAGQLATRYEITGVPTLMLFKGGQLVDTMVGMLPMRALKQRLEAVTAPATSLAGA